MNNLKFRARDIVTGEILEQAYMGQCFQWVNHEKQNNIVIEQFTGFKDAKGREIYLGDDLFLTCYGKNMRTTRNRVKYRSDIGCYWINTPIGGLALNSLEASNSLIATEVSENDR